jgi:imidazolonepropionase-like amidohydrolase
MKVVRTRELVDGTGREPIRGAAVVVDDEGTIQDIVTGDTAPDGAQVVDLSAYQVIPGLIDCHDHLCIDLGDEYAQAQELDTWNAIKGIYNAGRMVRGGVTAVRDVGEKNHVDKPLRRALNQNLFPGPRVVSCGEFIIRRGGHGWYFGFQVDGTDSVRTAVREQLRNEADFIKTMVSGGMSTKGSDPRGQELSTEEIQVLVEESHRANRKVAAHIHGGPGARVAIEAGIDSLEHGIYLTPDEVQMLAERGTFLVVTYAIAELAKEQPDVPDYYRAKIEDTLDTYITVISEARQRGVKVAIGGDGVHGRSGLEMRALVKGGFSPMQALQAATCRGAELIGLGDQIGTVEPGKQADLVAIEGDVLNDVMDVENVQAVLRSGVEQYPNFKWPTHSV